MKMLTMMCHSIIAYMYYTIIIRIEVLRCHILTVYIASMRLPVKQDVSVESYQESETRTTGSSVNCEEVAILQHSKLCLGYKPSDTKIRATVLPQFMDMPGEEKRASSTNHLEWYFGAGNIPLHIRGLLQKEAYTALVCSRTSHQLDDTCLSISKNLNLFITFLIQRFYLLNRTGDGSTELNCDIGYAYADGTQKGSVKEWSRNNDRERVEDDDDDDDDDETDLGDYGNKRVSMNEGVKYVDDGTKNGIFQSSNANTQYSWCNKADLKDYGNKSVSMKEGVKYVNKVDDGTKNCTFHSSNANTQKSWCNKNWFWILLLYLFVTTKGSPVHDKERGSNSESSVLLKFPLLKSEVCSNPEENVQCARANDKFKMKLEFCDYKCPSLNEITCMNSKYGMVFFCIPKNTRCSEGIGWQVERIESSDDESEVVIKEGICPEGYYQSEPSKCLNACRTKHWSLHDIPEQFTTVTKGDHIRPTILRCKDKAGFFNADNKSYVNFDESFSLHLDFCTHINISNPCASGQMILYNGTCVNQCSPGYERNETDFMCQQISFGETSDKTTTVGLPGNSKPDMETRTDPGRISDKSNNTASTNTIPLYLQVIFTVVGVLITVGVVLLLLKVFCPRQTQVLLCASEMGSINNSNSNRSSSTGISDENEADDKQDDGNDKPNPEQEQLLSDKAPDAADVPVVKKKIRNTGNTTYKIRNVNNLVIGGQGTSTASNVIKDLIAERFADVTEVDIEGGQRTVHEGQDDGNDNPEPEQEILPVSKEPNTDVTAGKVNVGEEFAKVRNELLSQPTVSSFSEYMKSVGALIYKDEVMGTVFRAGDDYVFTAFHVIRKIIDKNQNGEFDYELLERDTVSVNFNASVVEPACKVYRVCYEVSSDDPSLDFAVLKITNPEQLPKKMVLDRYNFERLQVNVLSGIGYGHPDQDSKKNLDPNCPIIFSIDNRIVSCIQWLQSNNNRNYYLSALRQTNASPMQVATLIDDSYIGIDTEHNIFLDITMEHGGSGSPFLTNDGKVVGILTHGHPEFCFKLPKLIYNLFPKDKRFESVLKLSCVYEYIHARQPALADKLF